MSRIWVYVLLLLTIMLYALSRELLEFVSLIKWVVTP